MIQGVSLTEVQNFTSKYDTVEPKTIWKIAGLNTDIFSYVGTKTDKGIDALIEAVRFGLKDFENFKDSYGQEIKVATVNKNIGGIDYKILATNVMNMIPVDVVIELGGKILKISKLQEEEIKN